MTEILKPSTCLQRISFQLFLTSCSRFFKILISLWQISVFISLTFFLSYLLPPVPLHSSVSSFSPHIPSIIAAFLCLINLPLYCLSRSLSSSIHPFNLLSDCCLFHSLRCYQCSTLPLFLSPPVHASVAPCPSPLSLTFFFSPSLPLSLSVLPWN